jgi:hypothetical protein
MHIVRHSYLLTKEDYVSRTYSMHRREGKYKISADRNRPVAEITVNGKIILK